MTSFSPISLKPHFQARGWPRLADAANVEQAIFSKAADDQPDGTVPNYEHSFPGVMDFDCELLHELPTAFWMNVDPQVVDRESTGAAYGKPPIIVNCAPVSRGAWQLRALLDTAGHAVTSRFTTVRPVDPSHALLYYWALLNSPFANAFAYCHCEKRDSLADMIRELPIPRYASDGAGGIANLATQYLSIVKSSPTLPAADWITEVRAALLRMDAEVLRLYDLPPRAERDLLQLFAGHQRPGVPFPFTRYYEEGFRPAIPLALYISQEYARTTAAALSARYKPAPASVLQALGEDE